jgi:hypothetical protein
VVALSDTVQSVAWLLKGMRSDLALRGYFFFPCATLNPANCFSSS